jgi:hypothetical protein
MTSDSSVLSSLRSLDFPLSVLIADGTSLPVTSRGTLSTSSFSVLDVSLVPRLTMNLLSVAQTADSGCGVLSDVDSVSIQDHHTQLLVGAGARRRDSPWLWDLDWLRLPSADTSTTTPSYALATFASASLQIWHHRLGHLCGSLLSSLVHHGLLGPILGDLSLQCQGCSVGKQTQLPYPTSTSVSEHPFDLIHSDVCGPVMSQGTSWETSRGRYDEHNRKFSLSMKPKFNRPVGERNHF